MPNWAAGGISQSDEAKFHEAAEVLWGRLRDTVMALRRLESFNFSLDGNETRLTESWLGELVKDDDLLAQVGSELVLRAFRSGADAINVKIIASLPPEDAVALSELARITGLPRLTLSERVNDLVQVGLAVRVLERDAVAATPLTRGFLGMVRRVERHLAAVVRERLPGLIGLS
jgi:DNA-binding HxlR family transcriptional regulator